MDGIYLREGCILIYDINKDQFRKHSAADIKKFNTEKKARNKRKEGTSKPSKNILVLLIRQPEKVPPVHILIRTYHIGLKQAVVKRKRLEYISVV